VIELKTSVLVSVWVYTLVAIVAEVYVSYAVSDLYYAATAIVIFAISQAAAVVAFYMNLREEPGSLILMVIIPLMFISGLLITVVASQA
jgi:cytochrome c oxidase subunit IV